ncbi:hypothetical protein HYPSUDRAFT_76498 [Hypholoma sublateritium FD-334 SS-4]|uniref:Uncharacterized protein n=1 Tax=Hypholoma sublateritium (strain FD-334 SS-4) TaxID=945553 RepID=A0A0D2LAZ9_HYPSF|nr:hypothetical protein HYPSUDRAFT_76498 [Hypholoma sublateritium FD-334 SS-4]
MLVRNAFLALVVLAYGGGAASVPGVSDAIAGSTAAADSNITVINEANRNGFAIDIGVGSRGTVAWVGRFDPCRNVPVAPLGVRGVHFGGLWNENVHQSVREILGKLRENIWELRL